MGFIEKLKLLLKVQKPAGEAIEAVKDAKKTKRWFHLAVTLIGILGSTAAALSGVIPPAAQLIAVTVLQSLYNIIRGADKADSAEIKGTFRTSEFYMTGLAELQKGIVALQAGGVHAEWFAISSSIIGLALSFGQNLAARAPIQPTENP